MRASSDFLGVHHHVCFLADLTANPPCPSSPASSFLRQPPPEPEHLTFLRRLFSPSLPSLPSPSPSPPLAIHIPPSSKRVEWLWKRGMPVLASGKKSGRAASSGLHASMRCCFEEEETEGTSKAAV